MGLAAIWSSPTTPEQLRPFRLRGGSRGILLVHGFAGTPPEVRELAEGLAGQGFDVSAPLLAGHGETPEAMARTRWPDWVASAERALQELQRERPDVFVGGQSLGGSIALHLAATHPELQGVVTMAAMGSPRFFRDPRRPLLRFWKYVQPWQVPDGSCDLGDPERLSALHSYARRPTACLESMLHFLSVVEDELPRVRIPALLFHGRGDRTVPVDNGPFILARLGSRDKQLRWMERSGHALTVDLERAQLNAQIAEWLERH